jgi:hypothetical protein
MDCDYCDKQVKYPGNLRMHEIMHERKGHKPKKPASSATLPEPPKTNTESLLPNQAVSHYDTMQLLNSILGFAPQEMIARINLSGIKLVWSHSASQELFNKK